MKVENSAGKVYYGMHFYPGVAEYRDGPNADPYRIFINEDTIRSMSPSFAGRPIFVEHVEEVSSDVDALRNEADGWVIESFFNPADGKTWAKFIVVSDRGDRAIRNGFKLSNAYIPKAFGAGGLWNGVTYTKEVTAGEFEHLAIVNNPRYEESRILTPEQFKEYNLSKELELKKLANSKDQKETVAMKFNLFKKAKVENSAEIEGMSVVLPKSKREVTIEALLNEADEMEMKKNEEAPMGADIMANGEHKVMVGEEKMSVNELVAKHMANMESMKFAPIEGVKKDELPVAEHEAAKAKAEEIEEHEAKEIAEVKSNEEEEIEKKKEEEVKKNNFESLKNAHLDVTEEVAKVDLSEDKIFRGKSRYGSK